MVTLDFQNHPPTLASLETTTESSPLLKFTTAPPLPKPRGNSWPLGVEKEPVDLGRFVLRDPFRLARNRDWPRPLQETSVVTQQNNCDVHDNSIKTIANTSIATCTDPASSSTNNTSVAAVLPLPIDNDKDYVIAHTSFTLAGFLEVPRFTMLSSRVFKEMMGELPDSDVAPGLVGLSGQIAPTARTLDTLTIWDNLSNVSAFMRSSVTHKELVSKFYAGVQFSKSPRYYTEKFVVKGRDIPRDYEQTKELWRKINLKLLQRL